MYPARPWCDYVIIYSEGQSILLKSNRFMRALIILFERRYCANGNILFLRTIFLSGNILLWQSDSIRGRVLNFENVRYFSSARREFIYNHANNCW